MLTRAIEMPIYTHFNSLFCRNANPEFFQRSLPLKVLCLRDYRVKSSYIQAQVKGFPEMSSGKRSGLKPHSGNNLLQLSRIFSST